MKKYFLIALFCVSAMLAAVPSWAKEGIVLNGVINVNTATAEELTLLPGVGEAKAQLIMEARKSKSFASEEDLLAVKGIGEKMIANWAGHIAFDGATTLKEVEGEVSATKTPGR